MPTNVRSNFKRHMWARLLISVVVLKHPSDNIHMTYSAIPIHDLQGTYITILMVSDAQQTPCF